MGNEKGNEPRAEPKGIPISLVWDKEEGPVIETKKVRETQGPRRVLTALCLSPS